MISSRIPVCSLVFTTTIIVIAAIGSGNGGKAAATPIVVPPQETQRIRLLEDLIVSNGYNLEQYSVETEDRYILTIHRVVPQNYTQATYVKERKPVVIAHGLMLSSTSYFINTEVIQKEYNGSCEDNFGFCLLAMGKYDVWLTNARGNGFSDGHLDGLFNNDHDYWNFSFDQIIEYDTKAIIDFVQNTTGHSKVNWIGYSQGSDMILGLLSLQPEYAQKLGATILWAPAPYMGHPGSIMKFFTPLASLLQLAGGEFVLSETIGSVLTQIACQPAVDVLCGTVFKLIFGDTTHLNETRLAEYMRYVQQPTSNWNMVHRAQLIETRKFVRYDYGNDKDNLAKYNTTNVPTFPLENIPKNFRLVLMAGKTDGLVAIDNVKMLANELRGYGVNVLEYIVPDNTWNHMDWIIGTDAGKLAYDKTVEYLNMFS